MQKIVDMRYLVSGILIIVLCLCYYCGVGVVNYIWPIAHWDISMGISITYSTVALAISMIIGTIVGLTVKRKLWIAVPAILPAIYWCEAITYLPYRSLAYMGIALFAYLVFALIITRYKY